MYSRSIKSAVRLAYAPIQKSSLISIEYSISNYSVNKFVNDRKRNGIIEPKRSYASTTINSSTSNNNTKQPGTAKLEKPWSELGFNFYPTNSHVRYTYKQNSDGTGGQWSTPQIVTQPYIQLHIGATVLHYGQTCFEGLKAFCHEDNSVHVFRPDQNAARMQSSCRRLVMPEVSTEMFIDAVKMVVRDNIEYVPPYGTNGALYLRPLLIGSGPRIGLQPATEYDFLVMATPVGDYYKGGLGNPVNGKIMEEYDRAAPRGVGNVKVAGNYAADLLPNSMSNKQGYPIILYLDPATQTTIEEFSTSNFAAIDNKTNKYITPKTPSVLPSVTNKSLMQVAAELEGLTVEHRLVSLDELDTFDECFAIGTGVVLTPVGSLTRVNTDGVVQKVYKFGTDGQIGSTTRRLYNRIRSIQFGQDKDKFGWLVKIDY